MNLKNIQQEWSNQGNFSDVVTRLFKESRYNKIDVILKKQVGSTILFTLIILIINLYTWLVLVSNFQNVTLRYTGMIMLILTTFLLYKNLRQLHYCYQINNSKPILELQKLIGKLKVERLKHNRFIFIFSNLFFWSLIILLNKWDLKILIPYLWEKASIVVIIHVLFSIIWFPLSFWVLNKYDHAKPSNLWYRLNKESYVSDHSLNTSLNKALSYLKEIEEFEK